MRYKKRDDSCGWLAEPDRNIQEEMIMRGIEYAVLHLALAVAKSTDTELANDITRYIRQWEADPQNR